MDKNLKPDDFDNEGFRACKKCGSRNTLCDGHDLDEGYIKCLDCNWCTDSGPFYYILNEWNKRDPENDINSLLKAP